ncbi:MAG: amidase [Deltaproteobacteria bacterium]|nr:amidase [Deltaproteobacteria bacterium]
MKSPNEKKNQAEKELCFLPALKLRDLIRRKAVSPVEVIKTFLNRIERVNPTLNAYCTVAPDLALQEAKKAERMIMKKKDLGPLHGVPVSIKDVTLTAGIRTTFGSKLYENFIPNQDALVVERLKKAGAIILGKTNTPEFAAGGSTFNKVFGITRNPWNPDFNSGGSSGGAAAAIAAGLGPLAEGNDLGGSLRIPASFCGVVGLRPSPGRVPSVPNELCWDLFNLEGPMARTIGDLALMLEVISGPDERSPISLPEEKKGFLGAVKNPSIQGFRVAWGGNLNLTPVDHEILEITQAAAKMFLRLGCRVEEKAPDFGGVRETALIYRGLRYVSLYQDRLEDPEFKSLVNPLVAGNVEQGLKFSIRDLARAERQRSDLWQRVQAFFDKYDLLLTPTVPIPAFPAETVFPTEINGKPMENYIDWVMLTYAFSMLGLPAISVPCGWTQNGLPVGLQIVARRHGEAILLKASAAFENAASWTDRRPSFSDFSQG